MVDQVNEKETRLATALKALPERELGVYRYFLQKKQVPIADDMAEKMFALYQRGSSCDEIRRLFPQFSLGQIVGARVIGGWDERRDAEVKNLQREVPAKVETVELETQEFLANLLHASHKRFNDALKMYISTGEVSHLTAAGVPLPRSMKELKDVVEMFRSLAGTDTKKVEVSVKGGVKHTVERVKPEEAEGIMDSLLGEVVDVEVIEQPKPVPQIEAVPTPVKTPVEMVEYLVKTGMPRAKAETIVASMNRETAELASKYADVVAKVDEDPDEVN